MELQDLERPQASRNEINWITASFMALFHVGAVAAFFFFTWKAFFVAAALWWVAGSLGIGMSYHRLLTHRGYKTYPWVEYFLTFCATLALEGGPIFWVKHENHTPTGSFKARTAVVYAAELFRGSNHIKGLVTATRGNHGQSVALAAHRFNVPAHVVVPRGNSIEKNTSMRAQGANLIEFGHDYQESKEHAKKLAAEHSWHFVPPYHRDIVRGVATYWLEFFSAVPNLDLVYVPIGQGSGICSCAAVRNGLNLKTKIIGVVAEGAPAYALSFEAGRKIAAPVTTLLGDGMACREPDDESLEVVLQNVDHIVQVSEQDMAHAMKIFFTDTHNIAEGAGAAGLAAALKEKSPLEGSRVGLVLSGANVDHDVFARVLAD